MSDSPTSRSGDLSRLVADGYEVALHGGHLTIDHIPYVTREGTLAYGMLASDLEMADNVTVPPVNHMAFFSDVPCDVRGEPLNRIVHQVMPTVLNENITMQVSLSSKPVSPEVYEDYHRKMTTYARAVSAPALALDPNATAQTYRVVESETDSVFQYEDTQSGRLRLGALKQKLMLESVAIVGLGGTGSYVLDFLSKTPAKAIHLYDADEFLQHNAFRSPSAAPGDKLARRPLKVDYFAEMYTAMHRNVVPHGYALDESNVSELTSVSFVFIAIDDTAAKVPILEFLDAHDIPFIDVGMGIAEDDGLLSGSLRTTFSQGDTHARAAARARIATSGGGDGGDYDSNIQIAELNAMNAAAAVIRYKQHLQFYANLDAGEHAVLMLATNTIANEELNL